MANHAEFNKIKNKLDGRHFYSRNFFDMYGTKINLGTTEVYQKKEVDWAFNEMKKKFGSICDENKKLKEEKDNLVLENYKLQKKIKKYI